jgi:hypothetical protein
MRNKFQYKISLLAFLFVACNQSTTFDRPQPTKSKPLTSFPSSILGKYKSVSDISILTVSPKIISEEYYLNVWVPKDSFLENKDYELKDDTFINKSTGTRKKINIRNDSINIVDDYYAEMFSLSDSNVLKRSGDNLFLNFRNGEDAWVVKKIALHGDSLIVSELNNEDDKKLEKIGSETAVDSQRSNVGLSQKQFKQFVQKGGFRQQKVYLRISKSAR